MRRAVLTTTFLTAAALAVTLGAAAVQAAEPAAASSTAKSFMTDAIQANLAEVALSQEALQKSSNADVKSYAQQMIDDHTAANSKATALALTIGVTPPTAPSLTQRAKGKMVSALSGSAFDKAYVHEMTKDHESVIKMFQQEATASDGEVSKFAGDTLPTLEKHQKEVQALRDKMVGK